MHWKLEPDSVEAKVKIALVAAVLELGLLVIEVLGGVVSGGGVPEEVTVQLSLAALGSTLPAESIARTENWCEATVRPE
ncbi:MAG TPA: hypothetical protein VIH47_09310 [Solirubrobacterales bacterium]